MEKDMELQRIKLAFGMEIYNWIVSILQTPRFDVAIDYVEDKSEYWATVHIAQTRYTLHSLAGPSLTISKGDAPVFVFEEIKGRFLISFDEEFKVTADTFDAIHQGLRLFTIPPEVYLSGF